MEGLEFLWRHVLLLAQVVHETENLETSENHERHDLLHGLQRQPTDDGELDGSGSSDDVEDRIRGVEPVGVAADGDQKSGVKSDHVEDESVSSPSSYHVDVADGGKRTPQIPRRGSSQRAAPEIEGGDDGSKGDGFVIVTTSDRSHQVGRENSHDQSGNDTSVRGARNLVRKKVGEQGAKRTEDGGDEYTNVVNAHRESNSLEEVVDTNGGDLQARKRGRADVTANWVPTHFVEPVEELQHSVLQHVLGGSEVEPRILQSGESNSHFNLPNSWITRPKTNTACKRK